MKKGSSSPAAIITILILLCIAVAAIIFGIVLPAVNSSNTRIMTIPRVSSYVESVTGESHSLQADISLKLAKGARDIDRRVIQEQITAIFADLDYDKVTAYDSMAYITDEVEAYLATKYDAEDLKRVYITAFISDYELPGGSSPSQVDEAFKGLFKNMR